jgi:ribosomal protein L33
MYQTFGIGKNAIFKWRCKMAAKGPRENITLECTDCKRRNYITSKNKRHNTERLELVKFCKYCNKRTVHKETK